VAVAGPLLMAEEGSDEKITITSGTREIAYDAKSGRFFETNLQEEECIPDEEYCVVDPESGQLIRLTVAEKERIFLDALQSYYATGRQMLKDDEFDLLKEDLQWNGSDMVVMNRKEATYLAAMQAYLKGEPMMPDAEFDALKTELKETGSKFAVSTSPKCYIDTGICTVTLKEDQFRSNLLYLPAIIVLTSVWLGIGFELLSTVLRINPLFFLLIGTPFLYTGSKFITEELLFPGKFIAFGPCPSCEVENRVYFGKILGVEGFTDIAKAKCPSCKTEFSVQRKTLRASTIPKA